MARTKFIELDFVDSILTVRRSDNSVSTDVSYSPGSYPVWFNVSGEGYISIDCTLLFSSEDDCFAFDTRYLSDQSRTFDTLNGSSFIFPENIYYYDINSVLLACNMPLIDLNPSSLQSLNGNGCEYLDGESVRVVSSKTGQVDRETIYTVSRSYFSIFADNGYIVHYDLVSDDGHKLTCPEALLQRYVATPTAP